MLYYTIYQLKKVKMQLAFELSGEQKRLARAEVIGSLAALDIPYVENVCSDRILVIDAELTPESELLEVQALSKRLGLTHSIYGVYGMCRLDEKEIQRMVEGVNFDALMWKYRTFAVRIRSMYTSTSTHKSSLLKMVGAVIKRKGYSVDLENPAKTFVLLLTAERCFFCLLLHSIDKAHFAVNRPHLRPFFSPGVIMPKFARAIVNLSGVNDKELFLDPFCGTGGILIEAGMIGASIIGADVQEKMVKGARDNLGFFGLHACLIVSDASEIPLSDKSVDAIGTDMPYGRSSIVSLSLSENSDSCSLFLELERLYQDALDEIYRVLKTGGRAVIVSHSPFFHSHPCKDATGFQLLEEHSYRVHKSLTRYIAVLEKM